MDENDFLNAFAGIDILKTEAVSMAIGSIIGNLRLGMIKAGVQSFEADALIAQFVNSFFNAFFIFFGPGGNLQNDREE